MFAVSEMYSRSLEILRPREVIHYNNLGAVAKYRYRQGSSDPPLFIPPSPTPL